MKLVKRVLGVIFALIGAFLIYAVINAATSEGGAKTGVAIGYVAGALVLFALTVWLWRSGGGKTAP